MFLTSLILQTEHNKNSLEISKVLPMDKSEPVNQRRTDNTMAK
jgi:hypothetical protein